MSRGASAAIGAAAAQRGLRTREPNIGVDERRFAPGTEDRLFAENLTETMNGIIKDSRMDEASKENTRSLFSTILKNTDIEIFESRQEKLTAFKITAAAFGADNPGYKKEMNSVFDAIEARDALDNLPPKSRSSAPQDVLPSYPELRTYKYGEGSRLYEAMSGRSSSAIAKALLEKRKASKGTAEEKDIDIFELADKCPPKLLAKIARVAQKMQEREDLEARAAKGERKAKLSLIWKNGKANLSNFFSKVDIETIDKDLAKLPQTLTGQTKEEMNEFKAGKKIALGQEAAESLPAASAAEKEARTAQSKKRAEEFQRYGKIADHAVIKEENSNIDELTAKASTLRKTQQQGIAIERAPRHEAKGLRATLTSALKKATHHTPTKGPESPTMSK